MSRTEPDKDKREEYSRQRPTCVMARRKDKNFVGRSKRGSIWERQQRRGRWKMDYKDVSQRPVEGIVTLGLHPEAVMRH